MTRFPTIIFFPANWGGHKVSSMGRFGTYNMHPPGYDFRITYLAAQEALTMDRLVISDRNII